MPINKEKVVVTGGAGCIGSRLSEGLLHAGFDVHIIDNLKNGRKERMPQGTTFHKADITDEKALKKIFAGAKYIFHTAALPRVQFSIKNPIETGRVNILGTSAVLKVAHESGVQRVIFSSSSSVYGDRKDLPLKETDTPNPLSPYALHKMTGEHLCRLWNEIHDLETVSLRYFNVYGPGMDPDGAYPLVIGFFIKERKAGRVLTITGDGKQTRDFTHVSDVVRANILAALSPKVGKGEVINIGAGRNIAVNHVAKLIGGKTKYIASRIEPKHTLADNTLAKKLLGWKPSVKFEDGIAELKILHGLN